MSRRVDVFLIRSRWVSTPITFGKPWDCRILRNSNVSYKVFQRFRIGVTNRTSICTISNPKEASTNNRIKSATFPMSIIELRSLLHSKNVSLRRFPLITVIGPWARLKVCFVNLRTRLLRSVLFPTPGGPTMATMTGGGSSSGVRLTRGT